MKNFTKDELVNLLAAAKAASAMDYLLILLSVNHGLRVSEVLSLTSENFQDGHLVIQRLKGSCKTAQKLLPNEAAALAEYVVTSPDGRLFPICRKTAWEHMKKLGAAAGIDSFKCFNHALKHTCGKLGLKGGMTLPELQTYLGHKSGASTMAYLREDDETASAAFAKAMGV
jgi:integrase